MSGQKLSGLDAFNNVLRAPKARWAHTAERFAGDPIEIAHTPKFQLDTSSRFFCIGSCFARNIEEALIYRNLDVLSKRLPCPTEEYPGRHNGIVNKFTTAAMVNELRWAVAGQGTGISSIFDSERGSVDLQLVPMAPPVTRERALERRRYVETGYFARIKDADVLIVTLGLVETWRDEKTGVWQNGLPGHAMVKREPDRFSLYVTSMADNLAALEELRAIAAAAHPGIKMIVTVSPVPLGATFTGTDIFTANLHSKSVLRAAAGEFASAHDDVDYFPSYEIVAGSSRAYAYSADCLHVRDRVVQGIVGKFAGAYLSGVPDTAGDFVEYLYLGANPDIDAAVRRGELASGFEHWQRQGRHEGRPLAPAEIPQAYYDEGLLEPPATQMQPMG